MPEPVALDELPQVEALFENVTEPDSREKVQCPECDREFLPSGIKRHITMAHRGGVGESTSTGSKGKKKVEVDLAVSWAAFQRGAALMVSFACSKCASVLVADADKDGAAIGQFCASRPKLRKQLEGFLDTADMLILVGTLAETAKSMAAHHTIGRRIGLNDIADDISHDASHAGGMQGVAQFMQSMDPEARQQIIDGALDHMANGGATMPGNMEQPVTVPEAEWNPSGV
jgi:hypothetical protein